MCGFQSCKKDQVNTFGEGESTKLSLKAAFDKQFSKSGYTSEEKSFNENFRTKILWDNIVYRTADTAIMKVKLLDDVRIYTNDSIPINLSENLIVKATKRPTGEWEFVKVIFLPEYGKDLPGGFTGRIISEGYFDKNYMVARYLGGQGYFATFNAGNTWSGQNRNVKLKAEGLPGNDPLCQPEEDGGTVTGYVEGEVNVVWQRPTSTPPVCTDDPLPTGGGTGGGGIPKDINALTTAEAELLAKLEASYKGRMTPEEIAIYDKMPMHDRLSYLMNAKDAEVKAAQYFPNDLKNGKGDAFRHAFFSALNRTKPAIIYKKWLTLGKCCTTQVTK
ncbi:hypothetical protein DRF65_11140 [Chryseobacterium pennae]|uniref:Uncharacterized protein n=1 Tax=Chryseobacterium pennae TaxID=2258962 RepID=A0A3D9C8R4_9FLAO|nr:hypothetical protein [Chryseobacterium pennae]REC62260.1 hypothetical protein DRF65_11140 [Chryseobacterium pennae]